MLNIVPLHHSMCCWTECVHEFFVCFLWVFWGFVCMLLYMLICVFSVSYIHKCMSVCMSVICMPV